MNYDEWLEGVYDADQREHPERDPDTEMEERAERKRIAMEMDGPHEEGC